MAFSTKNKNGLLGTKQRKRLKFQRGWTMDEHKWVDTQGQG